MSIAKKSSVRKSSGTFLEEQWNQALWDLIEPHLGRGTWCGDNFNCRAPYREDKKPSFSVNPKEGVFRDFGKEINGNLEELAKLLKLRLPAKRDFFSDSDRSSSSSVRSIKKKDKNFNQKKTEKVSLTLGDLIGGSPKVVDHVPGAKYFYSPDKWMQRGREGGPKYLPFHLKKGKPKTGKGGDQPWGLYRLDEIDTDLQGKWLNMAEGEKSAELWATLGIFTTTAQAGEWAPEKLEKEFQKLAEAKLVGVVFQADCDATGEKKAEAIAAACQKVGLKVVILRYQDFMDGESKDKVDIEELLEELGLEEVRRRLEKLLINAVSSADTVSSETLTSVEFNDNVDTPSKKKLLTAEELAELVLQRKFGVWKYHHEESSWREWDGKCWRLLPLEVFNKKVRDEIKVLGERTNTTNKIKDTATFLKWDALVESWRSLPRDQYINFENGTLNLETGELQEHQPEDLFTSYLPREHKQIKRTGDWLEDLKQYAPAFHSWADKVCGGNEKKIFKLLAIIQVLLKYKARDLQIFLHTYGPPGSGKGTFSRLLSKIVGKDNSTTSRLNKLDNDYELAKIIDKQYVELPDEDPKFGEFGGLKSLTGGDNISYRGIYKAPASAPFYGFLNITANTNIFRGDTSGLKRRMVFLDFPNCVRNPDNQMEKKLEGEISELTTISLSLPWASVVDSLFSRGEFEIKEDLETLEELRKESDPLYNWISDYCEFGEDYKAYIGVADSPSDRLYPSYLAFCESQNVPQKFRKGKRSFSPDLLRLSGEFHWGLLKGRDSEGNYLSGLRVKSALSPDSTLARVSLSIDNSIDTNINQQDDQDEDQKEEEESKALDSGLAIKVAVPFSELRHKWQTRRNWSDSYAAYYKKAMAKGLLVDFKIKDHLAFKACITGIEKESLDNLTLEGVRAEGFRGSIEEFKEKYGKWLGPENWVISYEPLNFEIETLLLEEEKLSKPEYGEAVDLAGIQCVRPLAVHQFRKGCLFELKPETDSDWGVWELGERNWEVSKLRSLADNRTIKVSTPLLFDQSFLSSCGIPLSLIEKEKAERNKVDYTSYPHLTSQDPRAKENQANRVRENLLVAGDLPGILQVISEVGKEAVKWVFENLLNESEKEKVKAFKKVKGQLFLDLE